ncbi:MAG: RNB domain-containing ribonuclease [Syntrophobacteraceae bacterium]
MSRPEPNDVSTGTVLEFFESKEILCGVVLAVKDGRFHVLSERNREINLTRSRTTYQGHAVLDIGRSRDDLVKELAAISGVRKRIAEQIDIEELWALLVSDGGEFAPDEIAEYLFPTPLQDDQAAAVVRVLLHDRLYFQSKDSKFSPRSEESVQQRHIELEKEAKREEKLSESAAWVESVWSRKGGASIADRQELITLLKDYAVFGQDARESAFVKEVLRRAGVVPQPQSAFRTLVRIGIWSEDENLLLHEFEISTEFSQQALRHAEAVAKAIDISQERPQREDLTGLAAFTVDSELTRDYDDALSVRRLDDGSFEVGVHIADAAQFVLRDDPLDIEAEQRASSIYLPDGKISMLPPVLSEGAASLRAGEERLALSFLLRYGPDAEILESRIVPSVVRVRDQLTYQDVDFRMSGNAELRALYELAQKLRQKRLDRGAVILPLPEMHVHVNSAGMIQIARYEKETPSQILVSEWMIEANAAAANFLAEQGIPSIFRSQAECRPETEFVQSEHELFSVYRQRRLFSRAELGIAPKAHCSLALQNYTTVTSPIRRYSDLIVQRQLKSTLAGNPDLYSKDQVEQLVTKLATAQGRVAMIQRKWTRYWLLKYIEQENLETLKALVLDRNARFAHLLIPDLFLETNAPVPENPKIHQGQVVRIRVDKVIPREDVLKVQILEMPPR